MNFNSIEFIIFYPIVLLLYFVLPKPMKWPMLLIASYFFYMSYDPSLVVLIFGTTLVSWLASKFIEKTESVALRRLLLAVAVVTSLSVLFFYKYFDFLSSSFTTIFAPTTDPVLLNLVLPVGISFYTFQTLSYVIDVYRGDVKTEENFFFYALFVSFFPQLVAGPIERPGNLIPQLREPKPFNTDDAIKGAKHMIVGFFKKICVADMVSGVVDSVYNAPEGATSLAVLIATLLFAVQIYCDFSGYTDIAIGCSRIMGIRLMKNFDHPYTATSIKEFWARWHISLSTWFRDYLYIPLGGSKCKKWRHLMNLMIIFLVSGIWHGAAWTFVLWGLVHGFYRIVGEITSKPREKLLSLVGLTNENVAVRIIRTVITFALVCVAWVIFRANSLSDVIVLFKTLFSFSGGFTETLTLMGLDLYRILLICISIVTLLLLDRAVVYGDGADKSGVVTKNGAFIYFVWAIVICWMLLLSRDMVSSFIYFRF